MNYTSTVPASLDHNKTMAKRTEEEYLLIRKVFLDAA
jgi:hypothetical protein